MSKRSVTHVTFTIERTHDATPTRVLAASADPAAKARWYEMHMDDTRISVSLATTQFTPDGGTRLVYTEQGAFLDGHDQPAHRELGTKDLLDALEAQLAHRNADAGSS